MPDSRRETITIAKVDHAKENESKYARLGVQDQSNHWYSCFDKQLWPRLTDGASVNIEWQPSGRDGGLRTIVAVLGTASSPNGKAGPDAREGRIMREVALKAAVDLRGPVLGDGNLRAAAEDVFIVANLFIAWLQHEQEDEGSPF